MENSNKYVFFMQGFGKLKYGITTNLPLERACHFKSGMQAFSPTLSYHLSFHRGDVDKNEILIFRHTFLTFLLCIGATGGSSSWGSGSPRL